MLDSVSTLYTEEVKREFDAKDHDNVHTLNMDHPQRREQGRLTCSDEGAHRGVTGCKPASNTQTGVPFAQRQVVCHRRASTHQCTKYARRYRTTIHHKHWCVGIPSKSSV